MTHDPAAAQGVNAASASAFILGELIREDGIFDQRFCRKAEARLWAYLEDVTSWALSFLARPPHVRDLMAAAAGHQPLADAFTSFYDDPHKGWDVWSAPERSAAFLRGFGIGTGTSPEQPTPTAAR